MNGFGQPFNPMLGKTAGELYEERMRELMTQQQPLPDAVQRGFDRQGMGARIEGFQPQNMSVDMASGAAPMTDVGGAPPVNDWQGALQFSALAANAMQPTKQDMPKPVPVNITKPQGDFSELYQTLLDRYGLLSGAKK